VTIAATFTVAWLPFQLDHMVLTQGSRRNRRQAVMVLDVVETLTYINSCVNPVIYALMWRPFRLALVQVR